MSKRRRRPLSTPPTLVTEQKILLLPARVFGHHKRRLQARLSLKLLTVIFIFVLFATTVVVAGYFFLRDLPSPKNLSSETYPVSTKIVDRTGKVLYEIYIDKNRTPINLANLPKHVYQASIAIEDQNFYHHHGFDIRGMSRALTQIITGKSLQGGSTITQQLVKTALLNPRRTFSRKVKEAILTIATEFSYSKEQILELYLNHIPYGGTAYGIEAAAHTYFNKSAKDLTLAQSTLLAGLPAAPSAYSPFGSHPEFARKRQKEVLRRMVEDGYITQSEAVEAAAQELNFATDKIDIRAPHFVFFVKDILSDRYSDQRIAAGGLRVTTTLDFDLQEKIEASLSAQLKKLKNYRVGNAASLVTNPKTGEILAMVGSQNYFDASHDGQVNVTIRERQPGSSIKPLNYAIAFETRKLTAGMMLLDIPTCFETKSQPVYCPKNYDGTFKGPVQVRFALGNSLNIPAVKTIALNGVADFIASASAMGISTWKDPSKYGYSLTLGGGEVKMIDLATAYGVLANQGVRVALQPILKVEDYTGKVLETYDPNETVEMVDGLNEKNASPSAQLDPEKSIERVLHRASAYLTSHILLDNNARSGAFGPTSQLVIPGQVVSVKTGTTNDLRDNWTVGYTPDYLAAVWVGNNDNTPMNRNLVSGVTGAAPIWNDIMRVLLKGKKESWPDKPIDVISAAICNVSGLLPDPSAPCSTRNEFFWKGTEPTSLDPQLRETWILPTTGLPPKAGEPTDGWVLEKHLLLTDPFTMDFCVDCRRPLDEKGQIIYEQYSIGGVKPKPNP